MFEKKQLFLIGTSLVIIGSVLFSFSIPGVKAFFSKLNPFTASLVSLDREKNDLKQVQLEEKLTLLEEKVNDFSEKIDSLDQKLARLVELSENQIKLEKELNSEEITEEGKEELAKEDEVQEEVCHININTASQKELEKITGVGPVIAQKIIEARPFSSLSDLIKVDGIGEKTLQKIIEQGCAYVEGSNSNYSSYYSGGGGGGSSPFFPKILISEIQISPIEERFIELYNPNEEDINLTDWYIQRKTKGAESWISEVSKNNFKDKIIKSKNHFLVARTNLFNPDILLSDLTLSEDNVIRLRNPNEETVDLVGWGQAQEFEKAPAENPPQGRGISRKWTQENKTYQDSNDNSLDFKIQTPTPKTEKPTAPRPALYGEFLIRNEGFNLSKNNLQTTPTNPTLVP